MAKTRLRADDRDAIRNAIIAHKFKPIEAALLAEENALAIQARARAYGDFLKVIEAAPKGAFTEDSDVSVNVAGARIRLKFGADYRTVVRVFADHARNEPILSLADTDKFGAKVMAWAKKSEEARKQRGELRDQVRGTLGAFSTFDDLAKAWPEAEQFVRERWATRPDYAANVPAVQLADLTKALDLPPEVQAEAA